MVSSRGILPPVSAALLEKPVYSEDELRVAIGAVMLSQAALDAGGQVAHAIVIAASFPVRAGLIIPARCKGLIIRGAGNALLTVDPSVATLFDVRAAAVSLEHLTAKGKGGSDFDTFVRVLGADDCRVERCNPTCKRFILVDSASLSGRPRLMANVWRSFGTPTASGVDLAGVDPDPVKGVGLVEGNDFEASFTTKLVVGGEVCVVGNMLGGLSVPSSTVTGSVFAGNVVADVTDVQSASASFAGNTLGGDITVGGTASVAFAGNRMGGALTTSGTAKVAVTGNICGGSGINTSGGAAGSCIVGNVGAGVMTPHAGDQVANNT